MSLGGPAGCRLGNAGELPAEGTATVPTHVVTVRLAAGGRIDHLRAELVGPVKGKCKTSSDRLTEQQVRW